MLVITTTSCQKQKTCRSTRRQSRDGSTEASEDSGTALKEKQKAFWAKHWLLEDLELNEETLEGVQSIVV